MEEREREFERNWQPRLWISLALLILIVGYLIAFVVGNDEEARVDFVFASAILPWFQRMMPWLKVASAPPEPPPAVAAFALMAAASSNRFWLL